MKVIRANVELETQLFRKKKTTLQLSILLSTMSTLMLGITILASTVAEDLMRLSLLIGLVAVLFGALTIVSFGSSLYFARRLRKALLERSKRTIGLYNFLEPALQKPGLFLVESQSRKEFIGGLDFHQQSISLVRNQNISDLLKNLLAWTQEVNMKDAPQEEDLTEFARRLGELLAVIQREQVSYYGQCTDMLSRILLQ